MNINLITPEVVKAYVWSQTVASMFMFALISVLLYAEMYIWFGVILVYFGINTYGVGQRWASWAGELE